VFTARYALSPYIRQISFVFKWLIKTKHSPSELYVIYSGLYALQYCYFCDRISDAIHRSIHCLNREPNVPVFLTPSNLMWLFQLPFLRFRVHVKVESLAQRKGFSVFGNNFGKNVWNFERIREKNLDKIL
jgi:hypothetical protein